MKRGELYRQKRPRGDTKEARVFVVVSRQVFIDAGFSTVICAPVYSNRRGVESEVLVGVAEGLKHDSAVLCDVLASVPRTELTQYVGSLDAQKMTELGRALRVALAFEGES